MPENYYTSVVQPLAAGDVVWVTLVNSICAICIFLRFPRETFLSTRLRTLPIPAQIPSDCVHNAARKTRHNKSVSHNHASEQ